jgi:hypothetical protein
MERRAGGERRLEGGQLVKHRNVEYGVEEDVPGRWRYIIYPGGIGTDERVYGDAKHNTREAAVQAAIYEIDNGLERGRQKPFG